MKPPDFFTVIFVPNARAKFRKYQVPLNVAKIAGRVAAVLGVVLVGAVLHYSMLLCEVSRLRKVEEDRGTCSPRPTRSNRTRPPCAPRWAS